MNQAWQTLECQPTDSVGDYFLWQYPIIPSRIRFLQRGQHRLVCQPLPARGGGERQHGEQGQYVSSTFAMPFDASAVVFEGSDTVTDAPPPWVFLGENPFFKFHSLVKARATWGEHRKLLP